jgi:pyruvate-formate lyase
VTLGGIDMQGKSAVNDLTYIMLKVTELLALRTPNVNVRYTRHQPESVSESAVRGEHHHQATPCFHNDNRSSKPEGQRVSEDARLRRRRLWSLPAPADSVTPGAC